MTVKTARKNRQARQEEQSRRRELLQLAAGTAFLMAITVLVYLPAIRGGFIWDDPDYVVNNVNLRTLAGLRDTWFVPTSLPQWYPLVHTTLWIEYHLWGLSPAGYHIDNVLLHAASCVLVWRILRR